jgi:PAS domain S-box
MRLILNEFFSRIHYKIIFPFLLLALFVIVAGMGSAIYIVYWDLQKRIDNQLVQVARSTSDSIVDIEAANLTLLREMALAQANPATGAPSVADAFANGDLPGLRLTLEGYFLYAPQRNQVQLDRLIAFNRDGTTILDLERSQEQSDGYIEHDALDLSQTWFVPQILSGGSDSRGDKFAGLMILGDEPSPYLATIAPVVKDDQVVGGLIVAMRVDTLLREMRDRSQAGIVAIYDINGKALYSTTRPANMSDLDISLIGRERLQEAGEEGTLFDVRVNEREYQFAYTWLQIRQSTVGILSVSLARDYIQESVRSFVLIVVFVALGLVAGITGVGWLVAQRLTRPITELADTASAVTAGDLERRSQVSSSDEVGVLASSFNTMTEHLLRLYNERAAIVESIVDGIVVCNNNGEIVSVNAAVRSFLGISEGDQLPRYFKDLPLEPFTEATGFSDRRIPNLFRLKDRIVRASPSEIPGADGKRMGIVCVLQDMTAEVAIDRAKNNFIATISHELRTPLTVMRGNADLLLRGLMGPLDPDQRGLIETMRNHAANMTALVTNVIAIAGLDSGSIVPEPTPNKLHELIEEFTWPMRSQITAKGLEFHVEVPEDLPLVLVDAIHLRTVFSQLLDNARRYTSQGSVTIKAFNLGKFVQVDIIDTGHGVPESLHPHLFDRFVRGDGANEGINSAERGIGLGLAIAKQLIERQGGQIWLSQTSSSGSVFSFTLINANDNPELDQSAQAAA